MLPKVSEDCSQCGGCVKYMGGCRSVQLSWAEMTSVWAGHRCTVQYSTVQYGAVQWHLCSTPGTPGTMGSTVGTSTSWALHLGGDGEVLGQSVTVRG